MRTFYKFRHSYRNSASVAEEVARMIILRYLVTPASQYTSRRVAFILTLLLSIIFLLFDFLLHKSRQFKALKYAFNLSDRKALLLSWKHFALPLQDFALNMRIIKGKEMVDSWKIIQNNSAGIDELRRRGKSFIIATGHFSRQSYMAIGRSDITPGKLIQTKFPTNPNTGNKHYDNRIEFQFGMNLAAGTKVRPDLELATVGTNPGLIRMLCKKLSEPSTAVLICIDAPWDESHQTSHQRPFAGHERRRFAVGVLRLAKISACPIVSLVCYNNPSGNVVFNWGDPVYITKADSEEQQIKVLDKMLDQIEVGVGLRPSQYLFSVGTRRKWNSRDMEWTSS